MQGVFSNTNDNYLFLMIHPRTSLHCKLVPVQYREYDYGIFVSVEDVKMTLFSARFLILTLLIILPKSFKFKCEVNLNVSRPSKALFSCYK